MSTTDIRPARHGAAGSRVPEAPSPRAVTASPAAGLLAAVLLVLVVGPGASEPVTSGTALLAFAAGWAVLGLRSRKAGRPLRWADALAAFLGASGLALVTLTPSQDALTAAAWVWPPAVLVLVLWSARSARRCLSCRSRWLVAPVLAVLALASVGALVQGVAARADESRFAMPGRLVDVGAHRLHLSCTGAGRPTVVLVSGLGGTSPLWERVVRGVAPTTRVCAYDRAGTGWSEDAPAPQDGSAVVHDLHRLLSAAGEREPYVLAGHSVGGTYAMTYAARHSEQVAGMVLLDAASPRQFTVLPDYPTQYELMTRLHGVLPTLLRLGAGRLVAGDAGGPARAFADDPRSAETARGELSTYRRTFRQAQALTTLGSTPLVVLSATDTLDGTAGWGVAQQALAGLSSNADLRSVRSSHPGLLDDPTASAASVTAIADVVDAARTGAAVRSR